MSSRTNKDFRNLVALKKKTDSKLDTLDDEIKSALTADLKERRQKKRKRKNVDKPSHQRKEKTEAKAEPSNFEDSSTPLQPKSKYRDRAAERQQGISEYSSTPAALSNNAAGEYSRFLRGEEKLTHLVKGLDVELMRKTIAAKKKREIDQVEREMQENVRSYTKSVSSVPKFRSIMAEQVLKFFSEGEEVLIAKTPRKSRATFEYNIERLTAHELPSIRTEPFHAQHAKIFSKRLSDNLISLIMEGLKKVSADPKKSVDSGAGKEDEESDSESDEDIFAEAGDEYDVTTALESKKANACKLQDSTSVRLKTSQSKSFFSHNGSKKQIDSSSGDFQTGTMSRPAGGTVVENLETRKGKSKEKGSASLSASDSNEGDRISALNSSAIDKGVFGESEVTGPGRPPDGYKVDYVTAFVEEPEIKQAGPPRPPEGYKVDYVTAFAEEPEIKQAGPSRPPNGYQIDYETAFVDGKSETEQPVVPGPPRPPPGMTIDYENAFKDAR